MRRPVIMVVSNVVPWPLTAGNRVRLFRLLRWLKKQDYHLVLVLNVCFVGRETRVSLNKMVDELFVMGLSIFFIRYFKIPFFIQEKLPPFFVSRQKSVTALRKYFASKQLIRRTAQLAEIYKPFAVIVEYIQSAPCFAGIQDNVLKIIDTHDVCSRKRDYVHSFGIEDLMYCTDEEEREYLSYADTIIAIQKKEEEILKTLAPERKIITVGVDCNVVERIDNSRVEQNTILFVASDNAMNRHGLMSFYLHAWPQIRSKNKRARLIIVGNIAKYDTISDDAIHFYGWREDLRDYYATCSVVINPVIAGTGLKIKTVEALCMGKPLVATENAVDGLPFIDNPPYRVCKNWKIFAIEVLLLLQSHDKRLDLQQRARAYARESFSSEHVYAPLKNYLTDMRESNFSDFDDMTSL